MDQAGTFRFAFSRFTNRPCWLPAVAALLLLCLAPCPAWSQEEEEEEGPPEPEAISLITDDNVLLKCTYYGSLEGEHAVPVILVHGWEGNRHEFDDVAAYLQEQGHAVIIPDLRGHGESTIRRVAGGQPDETIDLDRMRRQDFEAMVLLDLQAVKKFLMERHNEGELNIDLLTIVGSEMGAVMALNWCLVDWSWEQLPAIRQGRDVKAFVLISPPQSFRGVNIRQALANPAISRDLSAMIVVGEQDRGAAGDASRLFNSLERLHGPPPETEAEQIANQDLFYVPVATSLQGTELLNARGVGVAEKIAGFIDLRIVRKADQYPWQARRRVLD